MNQKSRRLLSQLLLNYYVALNEIMKGANDFSVFDSYLEPLLDAAASRKNQVVLRFYADYPGKPTGVPQFLIDEGLKLIPYDHNAIGKGESPDYPNDFLNALETFVIELGAKTTTAT